MNRKETKLLVESWRNLIFEGEEGKKYKEEDMGFTYSGVDVDIVDGGEVFMYGDIELFSDKVKNLMKEISANNCKKRENEYKKDNSLDDRTKKLRILSVYKSVQKVLLSKEFEDMKSNIRLCKFVKVGEKDWTFYDMSLRGLIEGGKTVNQYTYLEEMEEAGDKPEPGFRAMGFFKRELQPKNFASVDKDLIKLAAEIGNLKSMYQKKQMMEGFRSSGDIKNILFSNDLIKDCVVRNHDFNSKTQKFFK